MIYVSKTYSETTPESVEDGDLSDSGFEWENVPHTFRELVHLMRSHTVPSSYPACGAVHEWYSSGYEVDDYTTGTESETAIHYSRINEPRTAKYWKKAARAAGLIKGKACSA